MKSRKILIVKLTLMISCISVVLLLFSGCVNIKSEYPDITYYKLTQTPIHTTEAASFIVNKNIYIKPFAINSSLETSKIVVSEDDFTVKRYNYHLWAAPLNELLTDFTITRINRYGIFKKGVSTSIYSTTNDFILECNILNCEINNSSKHNRHNNVELVISATLLAADKSKLSYSPVFSKTYTKSLARKDNSIETAVDALSVLISEINDAILMDVFPQIKD